MACQWDFFSRCIDDDFFGGRENEKVILKWKSILVDQKLVKRNFNSCLTVNCFSKNLLVWVIYQCPMRGWKHQSPNLTHHSNFLWHQNLHFFHQCINFLAQKRAAFHPEFPFFSGSVPSNVMGDVMSPSYHDCLCDCNPRGHRWGQYLQLFHAGPGDLRIIDLEKYV